MEPSNDSETRRALGEFLRRNAGIAPEQMPPPSEWVGSGNTIGSLALRLGVLDMDQIDRIMDEQSESGELFGEIGVRLGILGTHEREALLELQRFHRCLDLGGRLVLDGHLDLAGFLDHLAAFLRRTQGRPAA